LCNFLQSKVSCCLHMYFLWRHHLPPDKSENDQDSDSDWFTYCIDIWLLTLLLVFNIWVSHALEMTIHFYHPTLELLCFWCEVSLHTIVMVVKIHTYQSFIQSVSHSVSQSFSHRVNFPGGVYDLCSQWFIVLSQYFEGCLGNFSWLIYIFCYSFAKFTRISRNRFRYCNFL
jgi:hypothetical protein